MICKDSTEKLSLSLVNCTDGFAENWVYLDIMHNADNDPAYHRGHSVNQKYFRNTIRIPLFDWVQLWNPDMSGVRFAVNQQQLKRFEKGSSAQEDTIHVHWQSSLTQRCSSISKTSSCWLFPAELELRHLLLSHNHLFAWSLSGQRMGWLSPPTHGEVQVVPLLRGFSQQLGHFSYIKQNKLS